MAEDERCECAEGEAGGGGEDARQGNNADEAVEDLIRCCRGGLSTSHARLMQQGPSKGRRSR